MTSKWPTSKRGQPTIYNISNQLIISCKKNKIPNTKEIFFNLKNWKKFIFVDFIKI